MFAPMRTPFVLALIVTAWAAWTMPVSARPMLLQDPDGKWIVMDDADWPQIPEEKTRKPGATMRIQTRGVSFNVTFLDVVNDTGVGYDDPTYGADRRAIINDIFSYLGGVLDHNTTCDVEFLESQTDSSGALASGGSSFFAVEGNPYQPSLAQAHIINGTDPSPSAPDIQVTMDFGWNWYAGTGTCPSDQLDLYSVMIHEITHGLGIISLPDQYGQTDSDSPVRTYFDDLLYTGTGVKMWNSAGAYQGDSDSMLGGDDGVYFHGSEAASVFGSYVPIYAPSSWEEGSSVSHWDEGLSPTPVMNYNIGHGDQRRTYQPFEVAALSDIGYTVNSSGGGDTGDRATIYSVAWTDEIDEDGDGYVRSAELYIDVDVADGAGTLNVYEKIYYSLADAGRWYEFRTTPVHSISNDYYDGQGYYVTGGSHNLWDWKIEVYREGESTPDQEFGPADDSKLGSYAMELDSEDSGGGTGLPDLTCPEYKVSSKTALPGDSFVVQGLVANPNGLAEATAPASYVQLYLSTDNDWELNNGDYYVGEKSVRSLTVGDEEWVTWNFTLPDLGVAYGTAVYLVFVVDSRNEITESSEDNVWKSDNPGFTYGPASTLWINDFGKDQGWTVYSHPRKLADVNGDGYADVLGFGDRGIMVALSTGEGFGDSSLWTGDFGLQKGWKPDRHPRLTGDINGDGRMDVMGFGDNGVIAATSTGSGFSATSLWTADFGYRKGWRVEYHPRMLGDVNGDGRDDVLGFGDNGVMVGVSTGNGFYQPSLWVADFGRKKGWSVDSHPRFMGDVNGDGKMDVAGFGDQGVMVAVSTGYSFAPASLWVADFGGQKGWSVDNHPRILGDVNGDGMDDVAGFGDKGVMVALSNGSNFGQASLWVADFGRKKGWTVANHPRFFADIDGDERLDLVGFGNSGVLAALSTGSSFSGSFGWISGAYGYSQGWRTSDHLRMMQDMNNDDRADVVGFGNPGIYVTLAESELRRGPSELMNSNGAKKE